MDLNEQEKQIAEEKKNGIGEEMVKVHDGLTGFRIGGKLLFLREMKIKKLKEFNEKVFVIHQHILAALKSSPIGDSGDSGIDVEAANSGIIEVLRFVFGEEFSKEWFEDNFSNRLIEEVVNEVIRQNKADWLLPFFGRFYLFLSYQKPVLPEEGKREIVS